MGLTRTRVRVEGIVQGVGFRPFVHALAGRLGLAGLVGNDAGGVFVEVEGPAETVERFLAALAAEAPPLAVIERVTATRLAPTGDRGFAIAPSQAGGERQALVSPDTATCADCLRELVDPADRRYRYPFVNCTNCGPRFTIVRDVPYDRPATTMAGFAMCADCAARVPRPGRPALPRPAGVLPGLRAGAGAAGPGRAGGRGRPAGAGRRPGSGTGRWWPSRASAATTWPPTRPTSRPWPRLRARKHREDKPFAVMVADLDAARAPVCWSTPAEEALLASPRRPIVLLRRRPGGGDGRAGGAGEPRRSG